MTVKDLLRNHDKDDHVYEVYIHQHEWISEKEIVKWSIMEGSDSWIYLNIKVK